MQCQFLGSRSPLARRWHGFRCPECSAAKAADTILSRGIERLSAEPAPADGLARALTAFGVAPSTPARHARRWKAALRHRLFPAGTFTVLTTLGAVGWLFYIDADPNITIPTPTTPSPTPNAYNILLEAAHAMPRKDRSVTADPFSTHSGPNRIELALKDSPVAKPPSQQNTRTRNPAPMQGDDNGHSGLSLVDKEAILGEYAGALALVRKGFSYPYQAPPVRSWNPPITELINHQQLAKVLMLEAHVNAERGDRSASVSSSLDAVELGVQSAHGASVVGEEFAFGGEAMGQESLWKLTDHIDAPVARSAARRLEHIIRLQTPFADTLQEEKWTYLASLQEMLQNREWRIQFYAPEGYHVPSDLGNGLISYLTLLPYSKSRILNDYSRLMDQAIASARQPYWWTAAMPRGNNGYTVADRTLTKQASLDPVVARYFHVFTSTRFSLLAGFETQNALLATALALRAYQQEHHEYPKNLQELVPEYLSAVPLDPFSNGQPLSYRFTGQRALNVDGGKHGNLQLYSIGPDGKDNGGTAIRTSEHTENGNIGRSKAQGKDIWNYSIRPESKGDIVAGLNTTVGN